LICSSILSKAALAHVIKDKAEAAYRRGTALEKRRKMMMAWQSPTTSRLRLSAAALFFAA
jgi:hypothetical protein